MAARSFILSFSLVFLVCPFAAAQAVVMDFTGQTQGPAPSTYQEDGIQLDAFVPEGELLFANGNPDPGQLSTQGSISNFTLVDGGSFDFTSIDVDLQSNGTIEIVGTYAAGGSVIDVFALSGLSDFETITPDQDFTGLSSLEVRSPNGSGLFVIDNITLFVPEPAGLADFDEDGDVDSDDLAQWQGDFGENALSDADNDGDSDGADFLAWQHQLGSGLLAPSQTVPEPGVLPLLLVLACASATIRRPHRNSIEIRDVVPPFIRATPTSARRLDFSRSGAPALMSTA